MTPSPTQRLRRCLAVLAGLAVLAALPAGLAAAALQIDFEQPYFVEALGVQCKDHALVKVDDTYHVFYIHSFPPQPGDYLRSERWLGHLTSEDLRHWTRQDSILPVSETPPQGWEGKFIWAPKVIQDPSTDAWFLYYTGVSPMVTQQTGFAYGWDLYDWTRWPLNPIYHPGAWSNWSNGSWANCRDPEIFHEVGSLDYYLLNTASTAAGLGAISFARSQNLATWTDLAPLFVNGSTAVLESPQLIKVDGLYHLFFTEEGVQGTSHMTAPTLTGAWTKDNLTIIDAGNAPEISDLGDEVVFSRHNAIGSPDGSIFYYRFDHIALDGPGGAAQISPLGPALPGWSVVFGSAFANQPTWGDNPHQRGDGLSGMQGNSYLATYEDFAYPVDGQEGGSQGVLPVGLLRGDPFTISENRLRLLVGGGANPDRLFVGLARVSDERLLFRETGQDSHALTARLWDSSSLIGEEVFLVVADLSFTAWGCISVDEILEFHEDGQDPFPPSLPDPAGPLLEELLAAAGYGQTGVAGAAPVAAAGRLLAPFPNPFNPSTRLRYELARPGRVAIDILDAAGRQRRQLLAASLPAGPGFVTWDGRDADGRSLPSGVYLARLSLDGARADTRKLHLVR
jgi:hypothetical protein